MANEINYFLFSFPPDSILRDWSNPRLARTIKKLQKFPAREKDIERLFSSPPIVRTSVSASSDTLTKVVDYDVAFGELSVFYSTGRCSAKNTKGYDLDPGIIVSFYFRLKEEPELSKLNLSLRGFNQAAAGDSSHIYYLNARKGLRYTVLANRLQAISYSLPEKHYQRCEDMK